MHSLVLCKISSFKIVESQVAISMTMINVSISRLAVCPSGLSALASKYTNAIIDTQQVLRGLEQRKWRSGTYLISKLQFSNARPWIVL